MIAVLRRRVPNSVVEWGLSILVIAGIALAWQICTLQEPIEVTPVDKFEPLEVVDFTIITPAVVRPDTVLTLHNGFCNRSAIPLSVMINSFGLEKVGADPIGTPPVVLRQNLEFTLAAYECVLDGEELSGPIPESVRGQLSTGNWRVYLSLAVLGPQTGQVQRVTEHTKTFVLVTP